MKVQIHIAGELIESIPIAWNKCKSYEERKAKIFTTSAWLKYRYRGTIALKGNWEIVLITRSKMNRKKVNHE